MKHKASFTLVELLTVAAIIAVLVGILLPAIMKLLENRRRIACSNNLTEIGRALSMYIGDHNGFMLFVGKNSIYSPTHKDCTPEQLLGKYIARQWDILRCPSDTKDPERRDWHSPDFPEWQKQADLGTFVPIQVSYIWSEQAVRGFYKDYPRSDEPDPSCKPPWCPIKYDRADHPTRWGVLSEGWHIFNGWTWRNLNPIHRYNRLDQFHKDSEVNMLFGDLRVRRVQCDDRSLRSVRSAPYGAEVPFQFQAKSHMK